MNARSPSADANEEIPALVKTLLATEQRLVELTAGEIDAVADEEGRTFLLRRAQEQLRQSDAGRQAEILNALPAHIALLDARGIIVSVNETWRLTAGEHLLRHPEQGVGFDYLGLCSRVLGDAAPDAWQVADGIREVLAGETKSFALEYSGRTPAGPGWFRVSVTPLTGGRSGAVVMHMDVTERRRAEQERRRFFTLSVDLLCIAGFDGYFQRINPAFLTMLGFTEAEMYARPFVDLVHPDDRAATVAELARLEAGAATLNFENRYRCKDGTYRWLSWTVVRYPEDKTLYAAGHDITERKHAEDGLRLFRTLVDQSNDSLEIIDAKSGRFLDGNATGYASLGYTREEFLARSVTDIDPGVAKSGWPESRENIRRAGTLSGTTTHRRNDGLDFPVEFSAKWVHLDRDYIVTVVRDITRRKQAEQELQLLSSAVAQSTESILITDARINAPGPEILFVNPAFTRMTGYTTIDVIGRTPRLLQGPRTDPTVLKRLRECLVSGEVFDGQTINYRKDGTEFNVEWQVAPIRNAAGIVTHFVALQRDVTARMKLAEQSLRAQRLESIGMLAAGISHDLNNVLAPIGMAVSLLRTRLFNPDDLRMLDILEKSAERGAGLVRQILGFVHGMGGEPRVLQVKHLLHDVTEIITETFPKSIVLNDETTGDLWPILANPTQIHQVLINLCVNARDAMPRGGTLTLGAANCVLDAAGAHAIPGAAPGAWLVLQVGDTGTGIPPELLERIWEPFFTTKGIGQGTGLGLPTVRGIIGAFHGFMTLQTEMGRGTTVRVYLPVAPAAAARDGSLSPFPTERGQGELILCVDDEQPIRDMLGATFTHAGYRAVMASDGEEALLILGARLKEIFLVVTDLDMPRMGGEALARAIRVINPAMKILVMSGISDRYSRESPCDFASAFLQKPFTVDVLLHQVQRLLHGSGSRPPLLPALGFRPGSPAETTGKP